MATKKKALKKKPAVDERQQLDRWKKQGKALGVSHHQWAIADWILRGEKILKSKEKAYDEAVKLTGMTRESLQSFASTARNVKVLTRVKGLWFGHHRLVAKLSADKQKHWLNRAKKNSWSVATFQEKLKGRLREDERQKNVPTNSDEAVTKFVGECDELLEHWSLKQLLAGDPPEKAQRTKLQKKLSGTADKLNELASDLRDHWRLFEPLQPGLAWTDKSLYEENKRRVAAKSALSAAAGGKQ